MKTYQSHKIVQAARINGMHSKSSGTNGHTIYLDNGEEHDVSPEWMARHNPQSGGYLVVYEDGYMSFSPTAAFEGGYCELLPGAVASEGLLAKLFGMDKGDGKLPAKITLPWLEAQILKTAYEVRPDFRTTVCEITLVNGATYRGESTCAVEAEFNAALGEQYAEKDAMNKVWAFYGVLLRQLRHMAGLIA